MAGMMPRHHAERLAAAGRRGDTEVGHLTRGELVVPCGLLRDRNLRSNLAHAFKRAGLPMGRYEVGGRDDSINPRTGMREFYGGGPGDPVNAGPGAAGGGEGGDGGGGYGNKEVALKLGARYGAGGWFAPPGVDLSAFRERGWL